MGRIDLDFGSGDVGKGKGGGKSARKSKPKKVPQLTLDKTSGEVAISEPAMVVGSAICRLVRLLAFNVVVLPAAPLGFWSL